MSKCKVEILCFDFTLWILMGVDLLAFPLAVLAQERKVEILAQETGAESACRVLDRSGRSCVLTAHLARVVEDIADCNHKNQIKFTR